MFETQAQSHNEPTVTLTAERWHQAGNMNIERWCQANGIVSDLTTRINRGKLHEAVYRFGNVSDKMLFAMKWQ
jgi:hypothetical protein